MSSAIIHLEYQWRTPMPETLLSDPILARFRAALDKVYGNSLERVVLFGSRARGDGHQDSDYDGPSFYEILAIAGAKSTAWRPSRRIFWLRRGPLFTRCPTALVVTENARR
jgi:hypothetical protein